MERERRREKERTEADGEERKGRGERRECDAKNDAPETTKPKPKCQPTSNEAFTDNKNCPVNVNPSVAPAAVLASLNLNKSHAAAADFQKYCDENSVKIAFLQEPPLNKNKSPSATPLSSVISYGTAPRAAICYDHSLNLVKCPELSSPDVATALWLAGGCTTILVSFYLLGTEDPDVQISELNRIVNYAEKRDYEIVLCGDSNAHSDWWGNEKTDGRGSAMEDFIIEAGLTLCNDGANTWRNVRYATAIDLTLCTPGLLNKCGPWEARFETCSDHAVIHFELAEMAPNLLYRDAKSTDWKRFKTSLRSKEWDNDGRWDCKRLDEEISTMTAILTSTWSACTREKRRAAVKRAKWWSDECSATKRELNTVAKKARAGEEGKDWREELALARKTHATRMEKAHQKAWNEYVTKTTDPKSLAQVTKELEDDRSMAVIHKDGKEVALEDTAGVMLDEHCPGSEPPSPYTPPEGSTTFEHVSGKYDFISPTLLRKAISKFDPYKTPGPDGLGPIMLQHLPAEYYTHLAGLMKIMVEIGHVPFPWRDCELILIPKGGKRDKKDPRAYRPISLMSFTYKAFERLCGWELEESYFSKKPLLKQQHAFRKGQSTDSALLEATDYIESGTKRGEKVLAVYLDIKGAFDHVYPSKLLEEMERREMPKWYTRIYRNFMEHRTVTLSLFGKTERRVLKRGCQQGSVASPSAWNIVFDELVTLINTGPFLGVAFADDGVIFIRGFDLPSMRDKMQQLLLEVEKWAQKYGLDFSPSKSAAIVYSQAKKKTILPAPLKIGGKDICYEKEITHLGVLFDEKLTFRSHINLKVKQVKKMLYTVLRKAQRTHGPSPALTRWIFNAVVQPKLMYACHIWAPNARKHVKSSLQSINRLAARAIAGCFPGTPTEGLEVMLGLPPLDLIAKEQSVLKFHRARRAVRRFWRGEGKGGKKVELFGSWRRKPRA